MRLLAIDTAGTTGSVALGELDSRGVQTLGHVDLAARTFAVRLIPAISTLLAERNIALADVDCIAVVHGPGSFTGMRISLSAVKGLAEATGKPVIALSRLAVMASMLPQAEAVHAVLDAGRDEFYLGHYLDGGWQCVQESLETADTLREHLADGAACVVAEDGVFAAISAQAPTTLVRPSAVDTFPLALRHWQQQQFADVSTLDANYLRRSDVELFARSKQPAALSPTV